MLEKIKEEFLTSPPHRIVLSGMQIWNPTETQLVSAGYKPIIETDMPDDAPDGQHYESQYTDGETQITQSWALVEDEPTPAGKSIEQRVTALEQDVSGISTAIERGLTT